MILSQHDNGIYIQLLLNALTHYMYICIYLEQNGFFQGNFYVLSLYSGTFSLTWMTIPILINIVWV